jgi:uncharacterized protein (DUF1015 family)
MDIFKEASRQKLRFLTTKGNLAVEQLWDLNQSELASCIKESKKRLNVSTDDELSFLDAAAPAKDPVEQLQFDILKEVYVTKQAALNAVRDEKQKKENNDKIMRLIADKQEANLQGLSIEELTKMLQ